MAEYRTMTLGALAHHLAAAPDDGLRWRLVAEFLEEYQWEPAPDRLELLTAEPGPTGDERWDVFLAALAEHLALRDDRRAPRWAEQRSLNTFWFPFNTRAARADAIVHAPVAFRRRGVFVAPQELEVALTDNAPVLGRADSRFRCCRATRDIDALFEPHGIVREEADAVAAELGMPRWWLNEQASTYVAPGPDEQAPTVFDAPGIRVTAASPRHLLAMKALAARRRDIEDLRLLVRHLGLRSTAEVVALCAEVFPDEPLPDRAKLILEDLFEA